MQDAHLGVRCVPWLDHVSKAIDDALLETAEQETHYLTPQQQGAKTITCPQLNAKGSVFILFYGYDVFQGSYLQI